MFGFCLGLFVCLVVLVCWIWVYRLCFGFDVYVLALAVGCGFGCFVGCWL